MIAFGGHDVYEDVFLQDLLILDLDTKAWRVPVAPEGSYAPCARRAHTADVVGDYMVVVGGFSGKECLHDVHALHLPTLRWRELTPSGVAAPSTRGGHSSAVHEDSVYVFGGWDVTLTYHNDLWKLDCDFANGAYKWTQIRFSDDSTVPEGRVGHRSCVYNNEFLVFGGYGERYWSDTHCFNLKTKTWREIITPRQPEPRTYHTLVEHNGKILVLGGSDEDKAMEGVWILDLDKEEWTDAPCPCSGSFAHTCVKAGNGKLMVYGGNLNGGSDLAEVLIEDWVADTSLVHILLRFLAKSGLQRKNEALSSMPTALMQRYVNYLEQLSGPRTDALKGSTTAPSTDTTPHRKPMSSVANTPDTGSLI